MAENLHSDNINILNKDGKLASQAPLPAKNPPKSPPPPLGRCISEYSSPSSPPPAKPPWPAKWSGIHPEKRPESLSATSSQFRRKVPNFFRCTSLRAILPNRQPHDQVRRLFTQEHRYNPLQSGLPRLSWHRFHRIREKHPILRRRQTNPGLSIIYG